MQFSKLITLLGLFLLCFYSRTQVTIDTNYLRDVVYHISSEEFEGRLTGSFGEQKAADYIASELKLANIFPFGNEYYHPFSFDYYITKNDTLRSINLSGVNVIGWVDNQSDKTILLAAHYDHIGKNELGGGRSLESASPIYFGADDNASGVAVLLEVAKHIKMMNEYFGANYLIAFFSGEEQGLQGSKAFADFLEIKRLKLHAMFNFDMLGRLNEEREITIAGVGTGNTLDSLLEVTNELFDFTMNKIESGVGASDFASFYFHQIPVLGFSTGSHEDYHTIYDKPDKINYRGMNNIINFILNLSQEIENNEVLFQETKQAEKRNRSSLKVTLGIMPGYAAVEGLTIEAVIDDKPAALAGLNRGDIIISIAECEVSSIYDYMECLAPFNSGDETFVRFLRNGLINEVYVKFL